MVRGAEKKALFILSTFVLFDFGLSIECSNNTNTREWSLYVVCWDKSQRTSDNCQWDIINKQTYARVEAPQTSPSSDNFFNCSEKLPLPLSTGDYTYHLLVSPQTWHKVLILRIEDPGQLTMKNCRHKVSEGDNVTCVCSTQREGSPPPVISWAGHTTSSTLHLYEVRGEHSKTYTCEMIWGKQFQTVSYSLLVRGSGEKDNKDNTFATSVNIIVVISPTAAAVLVIIIVVTVVVIIFIRAKKRRETPQRAKNEAQDTQSQPPYSDSTHGEDELVENRYYGSLQMDSRRDFKNVGDDYAEVAGTTSAEPDLYAGIEENNGRQPTKPVLYVETNKGRKPTQPELYATVVKFSGKEQAQPDNSRLREKKDFAIEENVYAMVDKGAKPKSHVISVPVEEMYAQVVKSPK